MQHILQKLHKARYAVTAGVMTFAMALGVLPFAPVQSASAVNCRVVTAQQDFYEAGGIATKVYYVPGASVSGCKDINVRNIKNLNVTGDYCATLKVQMFPTSGGSFYTTPKTVCSKDPDGTGPANGPVVALATNVINGTKYRIWYNVENLNWTHTFQIVD